MCSFISQKSGIDTIFAINEVVFSLFLKLYDLYGTWSLCPKFYPKSCFGNGRCKLLKQILLGNFLVSFTYVQQGISIGNSFKTEIFIRGLLDYVQLVLISDTKSVKSSLLIPSSFLPTKMVYPYERKKIRFVLFLAENTLKKRPCDI